MFRDPFRVGCVGFEVAYVEYCGSILDCVVAFWLEVVLFGAVRGFPCAL